MRHLTITRRRYSQKCLDDASKAVLRGMPYRAASQKYRVPKASICDRIHPSQPFGQGIGRRTAFSPTEEDVIISIVTKYVWCGMQFSRTLVVSAIATFVTTLTPARRLLVPFTDETPGPKFLQCFVRRLKHKLISRRSLRQDGSRFPACRGQRFAQRFKQRFLQGSSMYTLVIQNVVVLRDVDAAIIWHLGQCGGTPSRNWNGSCCCDRYITGAGPLHAYTTRTIGKRTSCSFAGCPASQSLALTPRPQLGPITLCISAYAEQCASIAKRFPPNMYVPLWNRKVTGATVSFIGKEA